MKPKVILNASKQPYLSIGIHYGGIKAFGTEYYYIQPHDAYLRKDIVKQFNKHKNIKGGTWDEFLNLIKNEDGQL